MAIKRFLNLQRGEKNYIITKNEELLSLGTSKVHSWKTQTFSHSDVETTNPEEDASGSLTFNDEERDFNPEPGDLLFCKTAS